MKPLEILKDIRQRCDEILKQHNIDKSELFDEGRLYYLNEDYGSWYDWMANEHLSPLLIFYDDCGMGCIKVFISKYGDAYFWFYKPNEIKPCEEIKIEDYLKGREGFYLYRYMVCTYDNHNLFDSVVNIKDVKVKS